MASMYGSYCPDCRTYHVVDPHGLVGKTVFDPSKVGGKVNVPTKPISIPSQTKPTSVLPSGSGSYGSQWPSAGGSPGGGQSPVYVPPKYTKPAAPPNTAPNPGQFQPPPQQSAPYEPPAQAPQPSPAQPPAPTPSPEQRSDRDAYGDQGSQWQQPEPLPAQGPTAPAKSGSSNLAMVIGVGLLTSIVGSLIVYWATEDPHVYEEAAY